MSREEGQTIYHLRVICELRYTSLMIYKREDSIVMNFLRQNAKFRENLPSLFCTIPGVHK